MSLCKEAYQQIPSGTFHKSHRNICFSWSGRADSTKPSHRSWPTASIFFRSTRRKKPKMKISQLYTIQKVHLVNSSTY